MDTSGTTYGSSIAGTGSVAATSLTVTSATRIFPRSDSTGPAPRSTVIWTVRGAQLHRGVDDLQAQAVAVVEVAGADAALGEVAQHGLLGQLHEVLETDPGADVGTLVPGLGGVRRGAVVEQSAHRRSFRGSGTAAAVGVRVCRPECSSRKARTSA